MNANPDKTSGVFLALGILTLSLTLVIYKRENKRAIEVARKYGGRVSFVLAGLNLPSPSFL